MYIGRFAPSPTGPLHFGSLVAALASYLSAKSQHGQWLLRMEDIDKPREIKGAADDILRTLERFGFEWHGSVIYQSQRLDLYAEYLQQLKNQGALYPCTCTRKEIADSSQQHGIDGVIYPKTCLSYPIKANAHAAWRIKTNDTSISFEDAIQGNIQQTLSLDVGDFILKRADGLFAYQLAVVVDDMQQGITDIVRGADLLDSTPRQIYLQQQLGFSTPHYAHLPIATNAQGEKLSKQTLAPALNSSNINRMLFAALSFLGQHPPPELEQAAPHEIWAWAYAHWNIGQIPKLRAQTAS